MNTDFFFPPETKLCTYLSIYKLLILTTFKFNLKNNERFITITILKKSASDEPNYFTKRY